MSDVQLHLRGDKNAARRLRHLIREAGFQIVDFREIEDRTPAAAAAEKASKCCEDAERHSRQVAELERTLGELRNLDVAKSQFLANVSHELRTPLTAIVTYGEVLRDGLLGEVSGRQREAIESVISSSRQLLGMIEEILTYARTNARAIELDLGEWDVRDVIQDVYRMNAPLIHQKQLDYRVCIGDDLPHAWADRDKVLQVLGNLVGNAVEFTPEGGKLEIGARSSSGNVRRLEVKVVDDGIGIAPEHHEMIFREFAQVDSSRARRHHGTGLGLAIARNFIELHGGEIWVESEPGRGSSFVFTLPSVEDGAAANGQQ